MRTLSKVVWHEGMHLAQHHFQLQSRYFEDSLAFALGQLFLSPFGLARCELDTEALRNGTVSLTHASGVMPDGLAFHFPDADPPPLPRQIRELFSPTQESHVVLLAVPSYRPGAANFALEPRDDGSRARYLAVTSPVRDDATGRDERPVSLGRKNFRLVLEGEPRDELVALPLARVRRDGAGQFIYDPEFIPPLLQIGASGALMDLLQRLVEILAAKSEALVGERRREGKAAGEYAAREVANFWLAHAIHSALPPLRHYLEARRARPEEVFGELARLGGALCTFSLDSDPRSLPVYDHDRLSECFGGLERHIRALLELVVPTNCVAVPLTRQRRLLHVGSVRDPRCLGPSRWILGVRSRTGAAELITGVPALVKVCAAQHLARLVSAGLPGMTLEHLPAPPTSVTRAPGTTYFTIQRAGPCWEAMAQGGDVGVYAPDALAEAEFELLVVLQT